MIDEYEHYILQTIAFDMSTTTRIISNLKKRINSPPITNLPVSIEQCATISTIFLQFFIHIFYNFDKKRIKINKNNLKNKKKTKQYHQSCFHSFVWAKPISYSLFTHRSDFGWTLVYYPLSLMRKVFVRRKKTAWVFLWEMVSFQTFQNIQDCQSPFRYLFQCTGWLYCIVFRMIWNQPISHESTRMAPQLLMYSRSWALIFCPWQFKDIRRISRRFHTQVDPTTSKLNWLPSRKILPGRRVCQ